MIYFSIPPVPPFVFLLEKVMSRNYIERRLPPLADVFIHQQVQDESVLYRRLHRSHTIAGFIPFRMRQMARHLPEVSLSSDDLQFPVKTVKTVERSFVSISVMRTPSLSTTGEILFDSDECGDPAIHFRRSVSTDSGETKPRVFEGRGKTPKKRLKKPRQRKSNNTGVPTRAEETTVTTLMIRNLPHKVSQSTLRSELDSSGYEGLYNFVYLPMRFETRSNHGYAFVNFETSEVAGRLAGDWHRSHRCGAVFPTISVVPAAVQGLEDNVRKWGPRVQRIRDGILRPYVRGREKGLSLPIDHS